MTIKLFVSQFHGWPAWTLKQGPLTLQIVPAVGGRLMGIDYAGTELCFINPLLAGKLASDDAQEWQRLCGDWSFPLWGGGKTWLAPQSAWPDGNPQRDLDSGSYTVTQTWCDAASAGVEMLSPVCRQSGVQVRRRIGMCAGADRWSVEHTLVNTTSAPLRYGIWDVLMLRRAGQVDIGLDAAAQAAPLAALRPLAGMGELAQLQQQGVLAAAHGHVSVACRDALMFKVGVAGASGAMRVRLALPEGEFVYHREAAAPADAEYAHGHPVEVFNAPELAYFEVESHAPLCTIAPGASVSYTVSEGVSA